MGYIKNVKEEFATIFNSAQFSVGSHQKSALKLKSLYNLVDTNIFYKTFIEIIGAIIRTDSQINPFVDRIMEFIGLTCYTLKQSFNSVDEDVEESDDIAEHPFLEKLFFFLLQMQNVDNFNIRNRTCQLINKILDHLIETDLSIQFCDNIEAAMLNRLNDPKLEIRLEGIQALHRFQQIENQSDGIINMLKVLIEHDRFAKVRSLCISKIAMRKDVIPLVISRLGDVDVSVRLAAFTRLLKIPRSLKIEQRRNVLLYASAETSDKITSYVEKTLLPAWLQHFNDDFHTFMKAIRLDADENDVETTKTLCEFILKTLFKFKSLDTLIKNIGLNDIKTIPYRNLNWETSNYWRILVQYLKNTANLDDRIEDILPELVHFCSYIDGFCNHFPEVKTTADFLENQFILKQLFTITKEYDVSDPVGRHALTILIRKVLSDVVLTLDTTEVIIQNLAVIQPNVESRSLFINELISDLLYPESSENETIKLELEFQDKMKILKSDLTTTLKMQESAISEKDYIEAGKLEKKICNLNSLIDNLMEEQDTKCSQEAPKKKTDKATLVKCLDIAAGLLLSHDVRKISSSMETLKRDIIFDLMMHENETVQAKAMHCYALLCIIDQKTANNGIHLFYAPISAYQAGQECDIQILLICIKSIVDLLKVFGTQLIATPEETTDLSESQREDHQRQFYGGTSLTNIIKGLVDLMDDEQIQVQETAGHGLCCLVADNIVQSSSLLSRLVLKWCHPDEQSQKLKQLIGVTFQKLSKMPGFHQQWEGAIFITLKAIIYAPDDSPYSKTNIEDIAKFLIVVLEVNVQKEALLYDFAKRVCQEIRKKPKAKQVPVLVKVLNMLRLSEDNSAIDELLDICNALRDIIHTQTTITQLTKFMAKLNILKTCENSKPVQDNESGDNSEVQVQSDETEEEI